jgi:hypothetical protein
MNSLARTFIKTDETVTRVIAGETLIVPVRRGVGDLDSIYTLNGVASRVWQLIDGHTPVEQIVLAISSEYEVTSEEAARDSLELLDSLAEAGLIKLAAEAGV